MTAIDTTSDVRLRRPPGHRMAVIGALGIALGPALQLVPDPQALPFVLPPILIGLVAALLAWRFGAWATAVSALAGVAVLASLPSTPVLEGLGRPDSFWDFAPGWLMTLGAVTAIVGGITAVVRRRTAVDGAGLDRRWLAGTMAAIVLLAALSAVVSMTSDTQLSAAERAGAIEVTLVDSRYVPADLSLVPGQQVAFAVHNAGHVLHTFTVDELDIDEALSPGQEILVTAAVPEDATSIVVYCRPHSEVAADGSRDGMVARATVQ